MKCWNPSQALYAIENVQLSNEIMKMLIKVNIYYLAVYSKLLRGSALEKTSKFEDISSKLSIYNSQEVYTTAN